MIIDGTHPSERSILSTSNPHFIVEDFLVSVAGIEPATNGLKGLNIHQKIPPTT